VTLRARWVTLRARWVTLRARWVTLRARWVTLRARWVTLRARWVTLRARWVTFRYDALPEGPLTAPGIIAGPLTGLPRVTEPMPGFAIIRGHPVQVRSLCNGSCAGTSSILPTHRWAVPRHTPCWVSHAP
jgi:hypothetical protein